MRCLTGKKLDCYHIKSPSLYRFVDFNIFLGNCQPHKCKHTRKSRGVLVRLKLVDFNVIQICFKFSVNRMVESISLFTYACCRDTFLVSHTHYLVCLYRGKFPNQNKQTKKCKNRQLKDINTRYIYFFIRHGKLCWTFFSSYSRHKSLTISIASCYQIFLGHSPCLANLFLPF